MPRSALEEILVSTLSAVYSSLNTAVPSLNSIVLDWPVYYMPYRAIRAYAENMVQLSRFESNATINIFGWAGVMSQPFLRVLATLLPFPNLPSATGNGGLLKPAVLSMLW